MSAGPPPPVSVVVRVTTVAAVVLVALVAALVSYIHMQEVAERAGERWRSWLIPASVDGLMVAASMVLLVRRRSGLPGGWLAWTALLGGVIASLACNIAGAESTVTARLLAAWPPLAFAAAFELLLQQRRAAPVGGQPPPVVPAGDRVGEPLDPVGAVGAVADPLAARVAAMVATSRQTGRPVGRRTLAKELGVSEHKATQLLAQTNGVPS